MPNAIHTRFIKIAEATNNISKQPLSVNLTGDTVDRVRGAIREELTVALASIGAQPKPPPDDATVELLKTRVDSLTCQLHLVELVQIIEGWSGNNHKQQNEQRRELCAALDRLLRAFLADEPSWLEAWAECKEDLPKNANGEAIRDRQLHLYDCVRKIRSAVRKHG